MRANQLEAYREVEKTTMSGRQVEAHALAQAANKLQFCQNNWEAEGLNGHLDEALKFNQSVWSIFQAELVREDNPLPKKLKEDILSLSLFIDRRIFDIMAYPAPEKLTAIININRNLAAGLSGSPG